MAKAATTGDAKLTKDETIRTFTLTHPGSCTGMFWRGNPTTGGRAPSGEWPRNGSVLRGYAYSQGGRNEWLEVVEWSQSGSSSVTRCDDGNHWMVFHQGGLLLHEAPKAESA
jgi:hypothetical protein